MVMMEKEVNVILYGIKNGKTTRQISKKVSKVKQQRNTRHPNGKKSLRLLAEENMELSIKFKKVESYYVSSP